MGLLGVREKCDRIPAIKILGFDYGERQIRACKQNHVDIFDGGSTLTISNAGKPEWNEKKFTLT